MPYERSQETQLPPPAAPPRRRFSLGRALARVICGVLALLGALPIALTLLARSDFVQQWTARETSRMLRDEGIQAHYRVVVHLWPIALELADLRVDATDGGSPFLTAKSATVRPRFFPLLSGKLIIDQIDIEAPRARVVVKDKKLVNLNVKSASSKQTGPFHAFFDVFAITDGDVDLTVDDASVHAHEVDLDVTTEDDPVRGSSFEIAVRAGASQMHRVRDLGGGKHASDDDVLCSLDGRVRITPDDVTVRRLELTGAADLDPTQANAPTCSLADDDPRQVEVSLNHVHVRYPRAPQDLPDFSGHAKVRAPVGIASRFAQTPDVGGWVSLDADVKYAAGMNMPQADGRLRAGGVRVGHYHLADALDGQVSIKDNVIRSPTMEVKLAGGVVSLSGLHVEPLAKTLGVKAEIHGVSFTTLLRDLDVHPHAHVGWDIDEVHLASFGGLLDPLKLDGDFTAVTRNFGVYDRPADDPSRERLVGFSEAHVGAHFAVRPDGVSFRAAHADLAHSHIQGGYVFIGFAGGLQVDAPDADVGLADITPLASIPLAGQAQVKVHVGEDTTNPRLVGDASIKDFAIADMPFGNVTAAHAELDQKLLTLTNVRAVKNKSSYQMPSARLDFGGPGSMQMDATAHADSLDLRDLLDIFQMNDDPRFDQLDANISGDTTFHLALGGPEDPCGGGFIAVHASPHFTQIDLLGEQFDDGDADVDLSWRDRLAGLDGADVQLHSISLHKVRREKDGSAVGSVLGSASIQEGGALHGNLVLESVPLSRLQTLGSYAQELEGTVSGIAQVSGTVDAFTVEADADVSPVHVRGASLGGSRLHVTMTQVAPKQGAVGKTRCGGLLYPAFDKEAYARDTSSHGEYVVTGDVFGGEAHVERLTFSRAKQVEVAGSVLFRKLELGPFGKIVAPATEGGETSPLARLGGVLSGDLTIDHLKQGDMEHGVVRFLPRELVVGRENKKISLNPTAAVIALRDDTLTIPPLELDLQAGGGLSGAISVQGTASDVFGATTLDMTADLAPVDLGVLAGAVPKLDKAVGSFSGGVHVTGPLQDPVLQGDLRIKASELDIHDLPDPITDVDVDLRAENQEIRVARGVGKFAGGTLDLAGRVPIRHLTIGTAKLSVSARGVRITPAPGISAGLDADLAVTLDDKGSGETRNLPHVTGAVVVTSFDYTRPINLVDNISAFGGRAKRTEVETYDPSLDAVKLDLQVFSRVPLNIHNNLIDVKLALDSGPLLVSGTNQRYGLRGELRAEPGGHFRLPFGSSVFDIKEAKIRFNDPDRLVANVDIQAQTEYRRTGGSSYSASSSSGAQAGTTWRINVHAYGDSDDLKVDLTSDPPLAQEDIVLLLTIGITRAEADQAQTAIGQGLALEAVSAATGASAAVRSAIPVIDDFHFGSAYSPHSGQTVPVVSVGKRITKDVTANVATGLSGSNELYANILWRLSKGVSIQGSYDNVNNDVTSLGVGNVGVDLRWRLEFE